MSAVNCPNPLTRRREYLRSPIARKVGGPLKAMSFLMSTQAAGFSPDDISSLAHWYDATEITGSDGDSIGTWADQEGTDNLTQGTTANKPTLKTNIIGGNQVLRFDGSDDRIDTSFSDISQAVHMFIVFESAVASPAELDGAAGSDDNNFWFGINSAKWEMNAGSTQRGSSSDADAHIFSGLYDGASSVGRIDGTDDISGDVGSNALSGFQAGDINTDNRAWNGDLGEILVYDSALSTTDRDDVESYLSDKWGVTI